MNPHLSDETLNEFLDQALEGSVRSAAAAHLEACAACSARMQMLSAVFSDLADLPPAPLARDLRAGVLAAVRAQRPAKLRPIADPHQPAFKVIFGLQLLAAVALFGFAWPFVAGLTHPEQYLGAAWNQGTVTAAWAGARLEFSGLWPAFQAWLTTAAQTTWPLMAVWQPAAAGLVLAAAGLFWLLGNALLLRPRPALRLRRHS